MGKVILQIIMAIFSTLGFCMLLHVDRKHMLTPTLGGGLCWAGYLLFTQLGCGVFIASLLASAVVGIYGEIFAHIGKIPTTVYYIPAIIPLVPGSNLYYMMLAAISQDGPVCRENAVLLAMCAMGIALGLGIVEELDHVRLRFTEQLKQRKQEGRT